MTVRKKTVQDGDDMPCHKQNILHTEVKEDPVQGSSGSTWLEIWYHDPDGGK